MKKIILPILFMLGIVTSISAQTIQRCGTDELLEDNLERFPSLKRNIQELENYTEDWINQNAFGAAAREGEIITIPVVVHVVYQNEEENISDLLIQSQIEVINEDFRMLNSNAQAIPDEFKAFAADTEIEFCLASLNPEGLPTSGITRTMTDVDCIANINEVKEEQKSKLFYDYLGGVNAWDTESYLNIWIANSCGKVLGVTPGVVSPVPEEDGVVIDYQYFGNNCQSAPSSPYNLGRTTTHEIGHYLNLYHPWSDCNDTIGDYVDDTPFQEEPYYGCPSYPQKSCSTNDMFMNFMNYVDDRCMSMFTKGQKMRMLAALDGPRKGLKESVGCAWLQPDLPFGDDAILIYPNPAQQCIHIDFNATIEGEVIVELRDAMGKLIFRDVESARSFRSIDANALSNGVYFVSFEAGERLITKKVLVAK
jgi:Pregnancy-associated plasma protein-A/Secretion system C-terminal sorting domain